MTRDIIEELPVRTNPDPNSRASARAAMFSVAGKRMEILRSIFRQPDFWSCERFDIRKGWLHQSTSAALNSLWRAGLLLRDENHVRMTYSNSPEYIYELPDWLRSQWDGRDGSLNDILLRNADKVVMD